MADQNATFELTVKSDSDVPIALATGTGTSTTYVVHCMDNPGWVRRNPAIERTIKEPGASTELISVYHLLHLVRGNRGRSSSSFSVLQTLQSLTLEALGPFVHASLADAELFGHLLLGDAFSTP